MTVSQDYVRDCVARALAEDLAEAGDITAGVSIPAGAAGEAVILAREPGVLAGLAVAAECFRQLGAEFSAQVTEGGALTTGTVLAEIRGDAAAIVAAERTALNFLQRLSGIATRTRRYVDAVEGLPARILDTRKTTPMLRALEKHAVAVGGGENHRFGLFDQVLLKENHFAMAGRPYVEVVRAAVAASTAPVIAEARDEAYDVVVAPSLAGVGAAIAALGSRAVVVTDRTVEGHWAMPCALSWQRPASPHPGWCCPQGRPRSIATPGGPSSTGHWKRGSTARHRSSRWAGASWAIWRGSRRRA